MIPFEDFDRGFQALLARSAESRFGWSNGHVNLGPMEIYIRIGRRVVNEEYIPVVCLANISTPPEHERTGLFTMLIERIRAATKLPIYVENCRPDFAMHLLQKYGWRMERRHMVSIDLFKLD